MGRIALKIIILSSVISLTIGCSKSSDSSGDPGVKPVSAGELSPDLELSQFTGGECLNLQKLSEHMNQSQFSFPARVTTYEYHSDRDLDALFTRNFGVRELKLVTLPFLRNVKQTDCSQITAETAYGKIQTYNITASQKDYLLLERAADSQLPESSTGADVPEAVIEAYEVESYYKNLEIRLASSRQLTIKIQGRALRPHCEKSFFEYTKTSIYRWASQPSELPQVESLAQSNYDQVLKYIARSGTENTTQPPPVDLGNVPPPPTEPVAEGVVRTLPLVPEAVASTLRPEQMTGELILPSETSLNIPVAELNELRNRLPVLRMESRCN